MSPPPKPLGRVAESPRPGPSSTPTQAGLVTDAAKRLDETLLPSGCIPHSPINITEEHGPQGFTWTNPVTGEDEYRPGSGVVAGNGTEANPYVIRGWCIHSPLDGAAVHLAGTDAHVRITENVVTGPSDPFVLDAVSEDGVRFDHVTNVTLAGNTIVGTLKPVFLDHSKHNVIADNLIVDAGFDGIALYFQSHHNTIANNTIINSFWYGMILQSSDHNTVRNNELRLNWRGIVVSSADYTSVVNNTVLSSERDGIDLGGSVVTLEGNLIKKNSNGVSLAPNSLTEVRNNTITRNDGDGILLTAGSHENTIVDNRLTHNGGDGVQVASAWLGKYYGPPRDNRIHGNHILGNGAAGLNAENLSEALDATDNWWGDASGPSGGVTDACTGSVADGSGASITAMNATVCFDPWRTQP